jgi:sodium transport system permease protein
MLLTVNVLRRIPWQDLGIRFHVSDGDLMSLLALLLPLVFFLSALVMFASSFARSFKEAQGYIGILILIPMVPGLISTLYPLSNRPYLAPIPVIGQYALAAGWCSTFWRAYRRWPARWPCSRLPRAF